VIPRRGGAEHRRSGHVLSVLHKQADGSWVLVRDANLLTTETTPA
jgi:ketosteroid isomerase-like protein